MKKHLKSVFAILITIQVNAQDPSFEWARSAGVSNNDYGNSITTDDLNNVYITGRFDGVVDFDPGAGISTLTSNGGSDIFIQKLDSDGNFIWAKSMGGTASDYGLSITTDASNNVYATGRFSRTVDFDPSTSTANLTSVGSFDIFVLKLDKNGNFEWAKSFGGSSGDYGYSVSINNSNQVLITGYFRNTVDFDPSTNTFNLISKGGYDIFIEKLDSDGNFIWAKSVGGTASDYGYSIISDRFDNIYISGRYSSTVDFDPNVGTFNSTAVGGTDVYIEKLDANGNFIWVKTIEGTSNGYGNSLDIDTSGNILLTGRFRGTMDFDPSSSNFNITAVSYDIFIQKLDQNGDFIWAKSFTGSGSNEGNYLRTDKAGNIYVTGRFENSADFDPGASTLNLTAIGDNDIFIAKLDPFGDILWSRSVGGTGKDYSYSLAIDQLENIYLTGYFSDTVDFDPDSSTFNLTSNGSRDVFIQKLASVPPTPLSSNLLKPKVDCINDKNTFLWETRDHTHSKSLIIHKSTDGSNFEPAKKVIINNIHTIWEDNEPFQGYYKITSLSKDMHPITFKSTCILSSFSIQQVITSDFKTEFYIHSDLNQKVILRIITTTGGLLEHQILNLSKGKNLFVPSNNFPSGMYYLEVYNHKNRDSIKWYKK